MMLLQIVLLVIFMYATYCMEPEQLNESYALLYTCLVFLCLFVLTRRDT